MFRNGKSRDSDEKKDYQLAEDLRAAILKGDVAMVVNILNKGEILDIIDLNPFQRRQPHPDE